MLSTGVLLIFGLAVIDAVSGQTACRQPGQCVPESKCPHVTIMSARERQALKCTTKGSTTTTPGVCCPPDKIFELDFSQCGFSGGYRSSLTRAEPTEVPWIAQLLYRDSQSRPLVTSQCLGALISNRYVLTTARCLSGRKPESVRLGDLVQSTSPDCGKIYMGAEECTEHLDVPVESTVIHPSGADLALIRLNRKVESNKSVRPICLPIKQSDKAFSYQYFELAGWHGASDALRKEYLAGMDASGCQSAARNLGHLAVSVDGEKQMCARMTDGTCARTESGVALVQIADMGPFDMHWVLFGIGSLDTSNCNAKVPVSGPIVAAKVEHYIPWILDNMKA